MLDTLVDGLGTRKVHRLHRVGEELRVAERRVEFPQVVRRPEIIDRAGEFLEEEAVGFIEGEPQREVVHLLDPAEVAGLAHEAGIGEGVGMEVEHLLLPPEQDVPGGERMTVGPAQAAAQGDGPHALVG